MCLSFSRSTPRLVTLPSVSSFPPSGPFPLSCLSPALSFCLTTATASAGMSAAWRDTHIKMNSPIRHCFRCYRTTQYFVIRYSSSLPQTLSCVQRLFPFKCSTIAHFLLHTQGYGSKQSSLVPQSICIVLTLALTAKGRFLNLASALTMSLSWGKRLNITASLRSWLPIQNRVILDCSHTTRCILHRKLANSMGQPIIGQVDYRCR